MPKFRNSAAPDGGTYILRCDRDLPPEDQVKFNFRDATPTEKAEFDAGSGYMDMSADTPRFIIGTQKTHIKRLKRLLTSVEGTGPRGPLEWPKDGTDEQKEAFLSVFQNQEDLYEVAGFIEDRDDLDEATEGE